MKNVCSIFPAPPIHISTSQRGNAQHPEHTESNETRPTKTTAACSTSLSMVKKGFIDFARTQNCERPEVFYGMGAKMHSQ